MSVVVFEEREGIGFLTLNRPEKLNALNADVGKGLRAALMQAIESTTLRVIIFQAEGKVFSAGGDFTIMKDLQEKKSETYAKAMVRRFLLPAQLMLSLPVPVIAKIQGSVYGGANSLIAACDFRIAVEEALFSFPFLRIGLGGCDAGLTYFLPRLVGVGKAMELLMLAKEIDAKEAERIGFIHKALPKEKLDEEVKALAERFQKGPKQALAVTKQCVWQSLSLSLQEEFEQEAVLQGGLFLSADHEEGVKAFLEKRPPRFKK